MPKRLLFIEDLYNFYSTTYKRSTHFDSNKSGCPIVVQVHGKINFNKNNKDAEGLLPVHLQSCHTNLNINGSNISDDVMKSALPSFSNRPILGYIHLVNGEWQFYKHNIHEDENGDIIYDEIPVGIIPESCNAQLVYDKDKKKTYCEVDGYIFEEYSKAAEILQREEECAVSVELSIRSLSYNAKEKYLEIEDFFFSGVTILGQTPDGEQVLPGMQGSNIKLADFSEENNSLFLMCKNQMVEFQERLIKLESTCFDEYHLMKGGNEYKMNKFEELLSKYNKNVGDITFDYEELSDEELEDKFEEVFGKTELTTDNLDDNNSDTKLTDNVTQENFEKMVRTYEISHEDIKYALYQLLEPYEETDGLYYWIVDTFDNYFVYQGGGKIYGQKYTKDGDNITFDGERYELFLEYLTESERTALNDMRSNYEVLKEFKENADKNEIYKQKEEIINSEKYAILREKDDNEKYKNKAFDKLVSEIDNYSITDLETQIKIIHSDYIAEHSNFSVTDTNKENKMCSVKVFANPNRNTRPKKRYGNLFSKNDEK